MVEDGLEIVSKEKMEFGKSLLLTVLEKNAACLELIKPKLKNWDADRIAALDMIILKLGTCEMLYFETIPVKVTINEYIDIEQIFESSILEKLKELYSDLKWDFPCLNEKISKYFLWN